MSAIIDDRLASKPTSFSEIPLLDIAALLDSSNPQAVAAKIREACENVGFMYIKNHGVPKALIERMYALTQAFFALPQEAKERINIIHSGPTLRGYIPFYGENVDPKNTRDFKECFDYGQAGSEASPFFGMNLMSEEMPEFKQQCEDYHAAIVSLARQLISAVALSLDLPASYFEKLQRKLITIQRILHYPPQKDAISQEELGVGAHTD